MCRNGGEQTMVYIRSPNKLMELLDILKGSRISPLS